MRAIPAGLMWVAALLPLAAGAQVPGASAAGEEVGTIIVTALKRESDIQDVPFAMNALNSQQLERSGSTNLVELARNVPGLTITDLGPGQSQVAIRGISAGQVVRDQAGVKESVGIYLDESPVSVALFTPDLDLYDLDRVEILRGPQGTLFGAGSSSGALRYITARPQTESFESSVQATGYGVTDGDFGGSLKGVVNVPLSDRAALRVVGYYNELAGFIDSIYPDRSNIEDVNDGTKAGARISMLYRPNDSVTIIPRFVIQNLDTNGYPREDFYSMLGNRYTTTETPVDPGDRGQITQLQEGLEDDFILGDLTVEGDLGSVTITSITSITDRDVQVKRDASQLSGSVTFANLGGDAADARLDSTLIDTTHLKGFSQEVRVSSNDDAESPLQWVVGAFYQDVTRDYGQFLPTPGYDAFLTSVGQPTNPELGAPADSPFFSDLHYDFNQYAFFGEATWRFNEQWSLTGGLRYYDFTEDRILTFAGIFADAAYTNEPGSTDSDGFSPRVILAFEPNEDMLFTAQVSQGFRLGGINDPLNVPLCTADDLATFDGNPTWEDEKNLNYELGAKTKLADGRITLNGAVFYSDIDDLQVIADAGSCSSRIILNADAEALGAEFEMFAQLSERWDFAVSATYVNAEVAETQTNAAGVPIAGIRDGNRLPTAPELQAAASVTYSWPWSERLDGYVNFTVQHVGSSYTQMADQEPPFGCIGCPGAPGLIDYGDLTVTSITFDPELPDYQIGNLRAGVQGANWEIAAFVNNLWDETAYLSVDRERGTRARVGYLTNVPLNYGLTVNYSF